MTHGSLFTGLGGFDLAAEWMGWENVFSCEIDPFCNRVTKHHFPNTIQHEDIRTTDFSIYRRRIDILSGGFPCQPYSTAGLRKGKEDERHLWPEMLRAIREVSPRWVVGENVRGLISWNGGMVFDEVQADLEAEGYEVLPFLLPAAGVNAPHRRDRIWFVAHATRIKNKRWRSGGLYAKPPRVDAQGDATHPSNPGPEGMQLRGKNGVSGFKTTTDAEKVRFQRSGSSRYRRDGFTDNGSPPQHTNGERCQKLVTPEVPNKPGFDSRGRIEDWSDWPTQPPVCGINDGIPRTMDGITFSTWRNESIKAYGNAIVPQVAYQIFKAIQQSHF